MQLSVAIGIFTKASAIPDTSEHSRFASSAPATVVTIGAVLSVTVIVCRKLTLVLPQPSLKFQERTRTYVLAQVMDGVVKSLTISKVEMAEQLSIAAGNSASAAAIPAASEHCRFASSALVMVVTTGALLSKTVMVCTKFALVLPQPSSKFQVRVRT